MRIPMRVFRFRGMSRRRAGAFVAAGIALYAAALVLLEIRKRK